MSKRSHQQRLAAKREANSDDEEYMPDGESAQEGWEGGAFGVQCLGQDPDGGYFIQLNGKTAASPELQQLAQVIKNFNIWQYDQTDWAAYEEFAKSLAELAELAGIADK